MKFKLNFLDKYQNCNRLIIIIMILKMDDKLSIDENDRNYISNKSDKWHYYHHNPIQ